MVFKSEMGKGTKVSFKFNIKQYAEKQSASIFTERSLLNNLIQSYNIEEEELK